MKMDLSFAAHETFTNLRRNIGLALATTVTVAVSLSLIGAAFLLRKGVENANQQWQGGIEFIVYMDPAATETDITTLDDTLAADPNITRHHYLDKDAAYDEFVRLFERESPRLRETVTPEVLPTNFKVVPTNPNADAIDQLVTEYSNQPGVYRVIAATDTIKTMQRLSDVVSTGIFVGAVILTVAGLGLVVNTIRTAMVSRRREIEVMKLVGASNWFVRVPFILEGMVQGLIGAGVAVFATVTLNNTFESRLADAEGFELFRNFVVSATDVNTTSLTLIAVGVGLGAIGSVFAIHRYLHV